MKQNEQSGAPGVAYDGGERMFLLSTNQTLYAFRVSRHRDLEHVYYGARLPCASAEELAEGLGGLELHSEKVLNILDSTEYFDTASFRASSDDEMNLEAFTKLECGRNSQQLELSMAADDYKPHTVECVPPLAGLLVYKRHTIAEGKSFMEPREHIAQARAFPGDGTVTLTVTLGAGDMEVDAIYVVCPEEDTIVRRVEVRNLSGTEELQVHKLMSCTLDLDSAPMWTLTHLTGAWGREGTRTTTVLEPGSTCFGSQRGIASHMHQPFALVSEGEQGYSEESGCHYGAMLLYSGNFTFDLNMSENGRVRLNAGLAINRGGHHTLAPGGSIASPEVALSYSDRGVNRLSQRFHSFVRNRVLPRELAKRRPMMLANTWESMYFGVTIERVRALVRSAYKCGVELLVVDDGWFQNRATDTSGLDYWRPDLAKLSAAGISAITRVLRDEAPDGQQPMKLGLWVEPEMCSPDSMVFRQHPEWILQSPRHGVLHMRRHEVQLDMSIPAVQEHVLSCLRRLLSDPAAPVSYLKWDHNRNMVEQPLHAQSGVPLPHAYTLGLWKVWGTLREEFPDLVIESCAAGGGRLDPGTLYFCPQSWTSDNTDPVSRARMLAGLSVLYPPRCLGAHVSACPNHQTGRHPSVPLMAAFTLPCANGFEINFDKLTDKEMLEMRHAGSLMRGAVPSDLYLTGRWWRIWDPVATRQRSNHGGEAVAYAITAPDQSSAVVVFALTDHAAMGRVPPKLRLPLGSLDAGRRYEVTELWPSCKWRDISTMQVRHDLPAPVPRYARNVNVDAIAGHSGGNECVRSNGGGSLDDIVAVEAPNLPKKPQFEPYVMPGSVLMRAGLPVWWEVDGDCVMLRLTAC
mmetsp:Transcript_7230/g.18451  ORF Transcript_7230/g.18451 Transcript_7230/m.18451 type:complete len:857 (-) Transcript_7230:203-2773(-)|eukprot:CAMPEP_0174929688 /NCGR_PEP_ID=MMETSP1355-20121228/28281_1 /TAXON_ID=464990 /ORGANISM="Hemiselmis tepida, Strain CCMP443" /LENGTH=856 /DNA_ID=CAMNT_0016175915 /DNA_START=74 /DNA_END=2644 /DNA_ORIENTATION=+